MFPKISETSICTKWRLLSLKLIYDQGDCYFQDENDTHYIAYFTNDYPLQHGKGWEIRINKTTCEITTSKKVKRTYKDKLENLELLLKITKTL